MSKSTATSDQEPPMTTDAQPLDTSADPTTWWSRATAAVVAVLLFAVALVTGSVGLAGPAAAGASSAKVVDIATTKSGAGYWEVAADGGIFSFGDATFYGSMGGQALSAPVVGMEPTPSGKGYWLVASDGGIFTFGDAGFYGSQGGKPLSRPVVGMAATPSGGGYWLVAADGGIFTFGDAGFYGSQGGQPLNGSVVGMAATPSGRGYWLAGSDGGIFTFGDAGFYGSMGGKTMSAAVTAIIATPSGGGYWLLGADGGIFTFGNAGFYGSAGGSGSSSPFVGMARSTDGGGYYLAAQSGDIKSYGSAVNRGSILYTPPTPPASSALGQKIADDAANESFRETNSNNCNPYTYLAGVAQGSGCKNQQASRAWCADFAKVIWQRNGANVYKITGAASSFASSGAGTRTPITAASPVTPKPGDAIVFGGGGHVAIVLSATSPTSVTVMHGNISDRTLQQTINPLSSTVKYNGGNATYYVTPRAA